MSLTPRGEARATELGRPDPGFDRLIRLAGLAAESRRRSNVAEATKEVTEMASNGRVIVGCTHGEDDPDRVVVAYLTAGAALDQGKDVVLWLSVEGVRLALDGYADRIRAAKEPPVDRLHAQFIEKGGRFYVCPVCFNERELDESDLVQNAELKGATPLIDFAAEGAMTFNY
jgi:uncharacterized protein